MPPTSYQEPAGGSKAAKFIQANPLDPMVRPFENGLNDEDKEIQKTISENVNTRLEKAIQELKDKHQNGTNEIDAPEFAPTGSAYQMIYQEQQNITKQNLLQQQKLNAEQNVIDNIQRIQNQLNQKNDNNNNNDNNDDDSDYDSLLDDDKFNNDDDPIFEELRIKRIEELRQQQIKVVENLAKGHGQYRTIIQDEFLPECNGTSEYTIIHFYHNDFQRCNIMDYHLNIISKQYIECKFLRIDSEKTPFFVSKLNIKTLPTLLIFHNSILINRLIGFDHITNNNDNNNNKTTNDNDDLDNWETYKLEKWLSTTNAIKYIPSPEEVYNEMKRLNIQSKPSSLYRGGGGVSSLDDDY